MSASMPHVRFRLPGLLSLALVLALGGGPYAVAGAEPASGQPPVVQPRLFLSGVQLPDLTRYSVSLSNQTQSALSDLQVTVQLPEDAVFDHALETPGFTQFQGPQGQTLTWNTADFGPKDLVDDFTFFLTQPASGAFDIGARWDDGQVQSQMQPAVQAATASDAEVTFDAATLDQGFAPVGNTGVRIAAVSGQIPAGTTVHVRVLGADGNPAAVDSDLWWCSLVEVDGLPAGAGLLLEVPARQPLPPQASIALFAQHGDQWEALPDAAQVSGDGQSILYVHPGGVVAAGTAPSNQPRLAGGSPTLSPSLVGRPIPPTAIVLLLQEQALAQLMVQPAQCPPGDCAGLPPCFNSALIAGNTCANGSVRAQGTSARGAAGRTRCNPGGGPCSGFVGLLPGGAAAPAGHGTACSFVGFTQLGPPGLTCSPF